MQVQAMAREPYLGEPLTPRERVVCDHLVGGQSAKEIGLALGISHRTVETHKDRIFRKLGVDNVVRLTRVVLTYERTGERHD